MKQTIKKLVAVVLPVVLFAAAAQGAGFALYEFSARTTAMGGATVANGPEAASLATNPSLITQLDGTQIQLGATIVTADATTTVNGNSRSLENDVWTLPNFYMTHKWNDDISFGIGAFSRYGLGGTYKDPNSWPGSNLAYDVKLETMSFTPTIAVKANEQLSLAMGLEAMTIDFTQKSLYGAGLLPNPPGYELHGTGVSWGGNFSLTYRPDWAEKWAVGAMYRSKIKQNLDGYIHTTTGTDINATLRHASAAGAITLPDSITTGIAFQATDNWVMEAGIVGTFWSAYDQIIIEYTDSETAPTIHNKKNYKDVYRLNFGTEYLLNKNWAVRAGYVFDKSPINTQDMDTLVPVDDRHLVSVGFGYRNEKWSVDFAYTHLFARDLTGDSNSQSGNMPMKYSHGSSNMFALTLGLKY
ncbi:MAG: outer membrane protein transport protein [Elusimicrobiaceae bacterium]|nr:outer membrane protein transport protein [Elusimicrobiaceae bacterium]